MTTQNTPRKIFSPPVFPEDADKTRLPYYISVIVPAAIVTLILIMITRVRRGDDLFTPPILILVTICGILLLAWATAKRGSVRIAGHIMIGALCIASVYLAFSTNGIRGTGFISFFAVKETHDALKNLVKL